MEYLCDVFSKLTQLNVVDINLEENDITNDGLDLIKDELFKTNELQKVTINLNKTHVTKLYSKEIREILTNIENIYIYS